MDTCDACGSVPIGQHGLVSLDKSADTIYVSRHELDSPELYTVLRHACIRRFVLSCSIQLLYSLNIVMYIVVTVRHIYFV